MKPDLDLADPLPRIPVPISAYWREFRLRIMPVIVFIITLVVVYFLWGYGAVTSGVPGVGEGLRSIVSSPRVGVVQRMLVEPYQWVKAGQPVAVILPLDPAAQVDLLRTQLDIARLRLQPSFVEENAVNVERLRMDLLRTKTELSLAHVNLQRAESDVRRSTPLYRDKLVSEDIYELSVTARDLYKTEVAEKSNAVILIELRLEELGAFGTLQAPMTNPILAAELARLEATYQTASSNWAPVNLIAPIDGMVTGIYRQERENVIEGESIMNINSSWSDRIVGYLRQPYLVEPIVGLKVLVTTRERQRRKYWSEITHVGAQVEVITNALAFVKQGALVDSGLPITVNLPSGLQLRPGEIVDLIIQAKTSAGDLSTQPRAELRTR